MIQPEYKSYFFLGIGGIGMSALAYFLHQQGYKVAGYDRTPSPITDNLTQQGIPVFFDDNTNYAQNFDCFIYTPAVPKNLSLFQYPLQNHKPLFKRAELLGLITAKYRTLAVAGTHGKTSTTAMLAHLFHHAHKNPTAFIGGIAKNFNNNLLIGNSEFCIVEADEFDRSFLQLRPHAAVITSMDPDHLDIYHTPQKLLDTYYQFAKQTQEHVLLHHNLKTYASFFNKTPKYYCVTQLPSTDLFAYSQIQRSEALKTIFNYHSEFADLQGLELHVPGEHNVSNMTAAITLALMYGVPATAIPEAVATFQGIQRRMDILLKSNDVYLIDDYAHHPQEIHAFLSAVRKMLPEYQLIAIFQPHLYTRTRDFYIGFAKSLSLADQVLLLPIYPAREEPLPGITSEIVAQAASDAHKFHLSTFDNLFHDLAPLLKPQTAVLTIGAGNIDTLIPELKNMLFKSYNLQNAYEL